MSLLLQATTVILCLLFFLFTVRLVAKGRLQLKYSLMWMVLAIVLLLCALFPQVVFSLALLLGFETPANFIFVVAIFFLLLISLSLSIIVSWQANYIRNLVQTVALMRKDVEEKEQR